MSALTASKVTPAPTVKGVHQVTTATPCSPAECVESVTVVETSTRPCQVPAIQSVAPASSAPATPRGSTANDASWAISGLLSAVTVNLVPVSPRVQHRMFVTSGQDSASVGPNLSDVSVTGVRLGMGTSREAVFGAAVTRQVQPPTAATRLADSANAALALVVSDVIDVLKDTLVSINGDVKVVTAMDQVPTV